MAISDQLTSILNSKAALKSAIEAKGVPVGAAPFADYASKVAAITAGEAAPDTWIRPGDWLTLTMPADTDQKFVGLFAITNNSRTVKFGFTLAAGGNVTVDWGDGTSNTYTNSAYPTHTYATDYDVSNATLTSQGYKQARITLTCTAGTITGINLNTSNDSSWAYPAGWLDIAVNMPSMTSLLIGSASTSGSSSAVLLSMLENVYIGKNSLTSMGYLFSNCYRLQNVSRLDSANVTSMLYMFSNCYLLKNLPSFDTSKVTNMGFMFNNCYALETAPTMVTNLVTSVASMFSNCYKLKNVPAYNFSSCVAANALFFGCTSLKTVPQLVLGAATTVNSMFSSCYNLESVSLMDTGNVTDFGSMFSSCKRLKQVPLFNTAKGTAFASMFYGCNVLSTIPLLDVSLGTDLSNMFGNCYGLYAVPALNTVKATSLSGMFSNCAALTSLPTVLITPAVNNFTNIFSNCRNLDAVPLFSSVANCVSGSAYAGMYSNCYGVTKIPNIPFQYSFSVTNLRLSAAEIDAMFTNLPTVTGQTITITGCYGAATCTRSIATAKGWTVTG